MRIPRPNPAPPLDYERDEYERDRRPDKIAGNRILLLCGAVLFVALPLAFITASYTHGYFATKGALRALTETNIE